MKINLNKGHALIWLAGIPSISFIAATFLGDSAQVPALFAGFFMGIKFPLFEVKKND